MRDARDDLYRGEGLHGSPAQIMGMGHDVPMELLQGFVTGERGQLRRKNRPAIDARVEPQHGVADQMHGAFSQAPVGAVGSAFDVGGKSGMEIDQSAAVADGPLADGRPDEVRP